MLLFIEKARRVAGLFVILVFYARTLRAHMLLRFFSDLLMAVTAFCGALGLLFVTSSAHNVEGVNLGT